MRKIGPRDINSYKLMFSHTHIMYTLYTTSTISNAMFIFFKEVHISNMKLVVCIYDVQ